MSLNLQMLQVARLAAKALRDSTEPVVSFIQSQLNEDGGFVDRAGRSDLYYTVFGIQCMRALQMEVPQDRIAGFLRRFGSGEGLDPVHLTGLARCWANLPDEAMPEAARNHLAERFATQRTDDGGFTQETQVKRGSAYGCFLAVGMYQDLGLETPEPERIGACLEQLETDDGGYSNDSDIRLANVPATAAAVVVQKQLGLPIHPKAGDFLIGCCHAEGGFFALPEAPMPDLLSTAVALHALAALGRPIDPIREICLDFVDTLWTSRGGFFGNWAEEDDALDLEYTYYGLLALGHLSV